MLLLLGIFFFVKGKFRNVAGDGGGEQTRLVGQTGNRASERSASKAIRPSPGTSFVIPEIVGIIRKAAPRDTEDEEVVESLLERLAAEIDDGTWPLYKVMASLEAMSDEYPRLAFILTGRLAPGSNGLTHQSIMIRAYASRDPDGALALLCRHGPLGKGFDFLAHSVVVELLRGGNPSDLTRWLRSHDSHEEELLVRKEALKMLQVYGVNREGLSILDDVLADPELPADLKQAALRGRLEGTAELGGEEWMKYLESMGSIGKSQ